MFRSPLRLCLLLAPWLAASAAHADLSYTFDTDAQGFTLAAGALTHQTDAGNGYLSAQDLDGSTDMVLSVPLGGTPVDWSAYLGGTLSFDGRILNGSASSWPSFGQITLQGGAASVTLDIVPADTDPTARWKTYSVALTAAQWGAALPTVLASLQGVTLNLESGNGPVEVVGIDNVRVTAVPEPGSVTLALAGLAVAGGLRRWRRA